MKTKKKIHMTQDKPIPLAWAGDDGEKVNFTLEYKNESMRSYAEIHDLWREFWVSTLQTREERNKMESMLKDALCDCNAEFDAQLDRMNKLAKATKGQNEKPPK